MRLRCARLIGLVLAVALAAAAVHAGPDGRALYVEHCGACHQTRGQGGIGLPLAKAKLVDVSDAYLRETIRVGRPGRVMPAFQRLSDAQVDAIVAFLREGSGTIGMDEDSATIVGDVTNGRALYTEHCVRCHAEDGSGEGKGTGVTLSRERSFLVMPASISNPGFLASATDQMIQRSITVGRKESGMPAFGRGRLSDAQIRDLVAYVRAFEHRYEPIATLDGRATDTHA
mgnify:FL=1